MNEIIYEETLDHKVTQADRANRVGFDAFMKLLQKHGWADENRNAVKNIEIKFKGDGNKIIWKAVLKP